MDIKRSNMLFAILFTSIFLLFFQVQGDSVVVCPGSKEITCPMHRSIIIASAKYGRESAGSSECSGSGAIQACPLTDVTATVSNLCHGWSKCNLTYTYSNPEYPTSCSIANTKPYLIVEYHCMWSGEIYDVCRYSSILSDWGILTSPSYPRTYTTTEDCTVKIVVARGDAIGININLFDLDLGSCSFSSTTCCADYIQFTNTEATEPICQLSQYTSIWVDGRTVEVKLNRGSQTGHRGFLLEFTAALSIPTSGPTTKPVTSFVASPSVTKDVTSHFTLTSQIIPSSTTEGDEEKTPGTKPSSKTIILISVCTGVGFLIIVIFIIVLVVACSRNRKNRAEDDTENKPRAEMNDYSANVEEPGDFLPTYSTHIYPGPNVVYKPTISKKKKKTFRKKGSEKHTDSNSNDISHTARNSRDIPSPLYNEI